MKQAYKMGFSLIAGLAIGLTAFAASPALLDKNKSTQQNESVLFTQTAASASIKPDPKMPGWSKLTLHHVNTKTVWFSDRPERNAGVINTAAFVTNWSEAKIGNNFKNDHPNASLVAVQGEKSLSSQEQAVFELSNPQYDANTQTLSYDVKGLSTTQVKNVDTSDNKYLHEVALFIDNYTLCTMINCSR